MGRPLEGAGRKVAHSHHSFYNELLSELFLRLGSDGKSKMPSGEYWLASQMNMKKSWRSAWYYNISSQGFFVNTADKIQTKQIRPVAAFRLKD